MACNERGPVQNHKRYAVPQKEVEKAFSEFLARIKFKDDFFAKFEKMTVLKYKKEEGNMTKMTAMANSKVSELEFKKGKLIESYGETQSSIIRKGIEDQVEALQISIESAQNERNKLEVTEKEIHEFGAYAKKLMEHPVQILANIRNMNEQITMYGLFFEEFPTYEQIANGTPKLTLVFKLSEENEGVETQPVTNNRTYLELGTEF